MPSCTSCPRYCRVDRKKRNGFCGASDKVKIAWWGLHFGEEPPISGGGPPATPEPAGLRRATRPLRIARLPRTGTVGQAKRFGQVAGGGGSGTIFFSHCNLRCVYCQNWQISQEAIGQEYEDREVAEMMLALQGKGAENINLVSPTIWASRLLEIIPLARKQGLKIPIVYNTNAYDSVETLRSLAGLIEIYLPDYKYSQEELAVKYSAAPHYPEIARQAILEMHRQVSELVVNSRGIAERGLIVRHLILPNAVPNSLGCLDFLRGVSPTVFVSLMSQYSPGYKTKNFPEINRPINKKEYTIVINYLEKLELDGWVQEFAEPVGVYQPDFRKKQPFGI